MFLLGPKALKAVALYRERNLTLEGLFATMGFGTASVHYQREARLHGKSKWTIGKKIKLFIDFFVAYSYAPIRLISCLGMIVAALGFAYAAFIIFNRLVYNLSVVGWSSLMVVVLVLGGLNMVLIGVLGEYLWRTLDEARGRPGYIVETILGDASPDG